jgi:predicted Zn-dependent protease
VNYQKACEILARLSGEHPSNLGYQRKLARAYRNLGNLQQQSGQAEDAILSHERSRDLFQALVSADPKSKHHR